MKRCVLVLLVWLALPVSSASAGTYDVLTCNAPGAGGVNHAWTFETFNASGQARRPTPPGSRSCPPASPCERGRS